MKIPQGCKTITFNIIAIAAGWLSTEYDIDLPVEDQTAISITIISLINIGLRLITKTPNPQKREKKMNGKKDYIPYFTIEELICRATGGLLLAEGFAEKLLQLCTKFNKPMPVTSCCRSRDYNRKIGGSPNSFHIYDSPRHGFTGTCAIDISIQNPTDKGDLMTLAWQLGWSIGFNKNFLHLDRRSDYTKLRQTVFWY